jgi:hypothetical protein
MGYLDNSSVIVDAILTKKGRELLAKGNNQFNITKFALADDEVDYSLYNPAHPLGTDYYGIAIENLPMLEASPDETTTMRYKLVTLPKGTPRIPQITIPGGAITLNGLKISISQFNLLLLHQVIYSNLTQILDIPRYYIIVMSQHLMYRLQHQQETH